MILWHSNAPWAPTGYGAQTQLFVPRLAEHHDVVISSFYGLEGSRLSWDGIKVLPGLGGEFGSLYLTEHAKRTFGSVQGGLVVTLLDVWVLEAAKVAPLNMASWVPVDHDPVPPNVHAWFTETGAVPLAMSRFGEERLEAHDPIYVPHGVDTSIYRPHDQATVREQVGVDPDAFLVGMVAANKGRPSRKGFQQAFEAFREFHRKHDNAQLYLHTVVDAQHASGENLLELLAALEIPQEAVLIADQYRMMLDPMPPARMAEVYSTFDVLLNPAMGEGFGVPIVEAQACGIPAIVTDFSAMPEVCGAGWHIGARPYWTGQRSWQAVPDVPDIIGSLEECHGLSPTAKQKLAGKARDHAKQYDVERVLVEHMLPALEEITERIGTEPEIEPVAA